MVAAALIWLFGFIIGVVADEVFRPPVSKIVGKVRIRFRRWWSPEPDLAELLGTLRFLYPLTDKSKRVIDITGFKPVLRVDGCFEIFHSHHYKGWEEKNFEFILEKDTVPLPDDLQAICDTYPTKGENRGKYRVRQLLPDLTERTTVQFVLSPTDYKSTFPVQFRAFEPLIPAGDGTRIAPIDKYGKELLEFDTCKLPNIVCAHCVLALPNGQLLVTQRARKGDVDWEWGKWCVSFEEQMHSGFGTRVPDKHIWDTIRAGAEEELGCNPKDIDIRVLSIAFEPGYTVVDPIPIIRAPLTLESINAHWALKAQDKEELRRVESIDWTVDALAPILFGNAVEIGGTRVEPTEWHVTSRMRILVSLFHRYGIENTLSALRKWEQLNLGPSV